MAAQLQELILYHYTKYPNMQIADVFKLLYQNEFGPGHMVSSTQASLAMLLEEAATLPKNTAAPEVIEPIGNGLCRLYLGALQSGLTAQTLNRFFVLTANQPQGNISAFEEKLAIFEQLCIEGQLPFAAAEVARQIKAYCAAGYPAMHHSTQYNAAYAPAYRVVDKRFCDFLPLFSRIDALLLQKKRIICAIDGGCASGKTTLAALLQQVYACNVFSMDDFFLQPAQRTMERLAEPGGNVDHERFYKEVLAPLLGGRPFTYRPYDCATQALAAEVAVQPHPLSIVEGVYSLHPMLAGSYDSKVFLQIDESAQKERLLSRNKGLYNRFIEEWMPLENNYFKALQIAEQCELIFTV